jgi:hypothetical protein
MQSLFDMKFKVDPQVIELLQSFETDSKTITGKYNDFLAYVYMTFDKHISLSKSDRNMNKYKKMRNSVLSYIVANERVIRSELK